MLFQRHNEVWVTVTKSSHRDDEWRFQRIAEVAQQNSTQQNLLCRVFWQKSFTLWMISVLRSTVLNAPFSYIVCLNRFELQTLLFSGSNHSWMSALSLFLDPHVLLYGFPQGSILPTLLFICIPQIYPGVTGQNIPSARVYPGVLWPRPIYISGHILA